jgi:hypothetical protein
MAFVSKRSLRPALVVVALVGLGAPLSVALLGRSRLGYRAAFRSEADRGLRRAAPTAVVSEAELGPLPPPVQRYLRYVGVVGKPRVQNLHAIFRGQMRSTPTGPWMNVKAEQYSFFDEPSRLFLMRASRFGLPFEALHMYVGHSATMRVKVASLVKVVEAQGAQMNQSETVTMFNDMCLLAPATLIAPSIGWKGIDANTVQASFTNAGNTITATLRFAPDGRLTDFTSQDRWQTTDGTTFRKLPWSTPVREYREFHGFKLAAAGEAVWQTPEGPLPYARFEFAEVAYNVTAR